MKLTTKELIPNSIMRLLRLVLLSGVVIGMPLFAVDQPPHDHAAPAKLVQIVREATQQFIDVNNAGPDYIPLFGCVSGPDHGAMGIHYLNLSLVGDGEIDELHPE